MNNGQFFSILFVSVAIFFGAIRGIKQSQDARAEHEAVCVLRGQVNDLMKRVQKLEGFNGEL
jgi:hypothetical protein